MSDLIERLEKLMNKDGLCMEWPQYVTSICEILLDHLKESEVEKKFPNPSTNHRSRA
jgi:hypothetical protein